MRDEKKDFLETLASWSEGDLVKLDGAPAWSDKRYQKNG